MANRHGSYDVLTPSNTSSKGSIVIGGLLGFIIAGASVRKVYCYDTATTAPTANNDINDTANIGQSFGIGDLWVNTTNDYIYACVDNTAGNAIWSRLDGSSGTTLHADLTDLATSGHDADIIAYDNTTSGLTASEVQSAIDQVVQQSSLTLVSDRWYDQSLTWACDNLTTFQIANSTDEIVATPIYIPNNITIDKMAINVTTGDADGAGRLGIYSIGTDGKPSTLIAQGSTTVAMTSGTHETSFAIPLDIEKGWYWLAFAYNLDSNGAYTRAISNGENLGLLGFTNASDTTKTLFMYAETDITTSLPSTFPIPLYFSYQAPRILFHVEA
jgi:hypothetical protein